MVEKHLARKHPQRERAPSRGPGGHHARPGTPGAVRVEKGPTGAEVGDRGAVGGAVEEVLSLLYGAACRSALVGSWSGGGACVYVPLRGWWMISHTFPHTNPLQTIK